MKNRVPANPGRVLITPEDGSAAFYATLMRADNPTEEGDPLSKETLLKDATAALYGLDATAVPDDVLDLLSNVIPSPYGMLSLKTVDSSGSPISTTLSISPNVDGSSIVSTGSDGFLRAYVQPGTYTISNDSNVFQTAEPASATITIKAGQVTKASFTIAKITSGEIDITTSGNLVIPKWMNDIDLFCVGGGGSGGAYAIVLRKSSMYIGAGGGAGGKTATLLNQNISGKTIKIKIGAGGAAATASKLNADETTGVSGPGKSGGASSISVLDESGNEVVLLSADGGTGGSGGSANNASSRGWAGGSGGSGGGGSSYESTEVNAAGGSDGSDGSSNYGGSGQGTTTRKFGEADGTLYSGGGGGAAKTTALEAGGDGGGGAGAHYYSTSSTTVGTTTAEDASMYGGGGGGAFRMTAASSATAISGAGYQGLVSLRWGA